MPNSNKSNADGGNPAPKPKVTLPDTAHCRVKYSHLVGFFNCLVSNPEGCKHAEPYKDSIFCFHPDRKEILARTKS